MPKVLIGLFDDYDEAVRVRTELVSGGFPTDRVELTATRDPGQAGTGPAESLRQKLTDYFRVLLPGGDGERRADELAGAVCGGDSTVTVHPRGPAELADARELLERHGASQVVDWGVEDTGTDVIPPTGLDTREPRGSRRT